MDQSSMRRELGKSLSDRDIKILCYPAKVKVIQYKDLASKRNIDEVLDRYDALVILYTTSEGYGHWVTVLPVDNETVEFFDPYGIKIDRELKFVPDEIKRRDNEDYPHLTRLLYNSRYEKFVYNSTKLQKFVKGVNTCGRWACVRIRFRHVPLKDFLDAFKGLGSNSDSLVVGLSNLMQLQHQQ